jgi:hypothetical protein
MNQPLPIKKTLLSVMMMISFYAVAQTSELQGKWILDKVVTYNGEPLEINNERYSSLLIYYIRPKELQINHQKFKAQFSTTKISTTFKNVNYSFEDKYLKIVDPSMNTVEYFLKPDDFMLKYPEFKMKEMVIGRDTLLVANKITDYEFNNKLAFEEFIIKDVPFNKPNKGDNLHFEIEFILTKESKIKGITIRKSISSEFDNAYKLNLIKAEPFFKNNTQKDILIVLEENFGQYYNKIKDPNEKELYDILRVADALYKSNKFEEAILEYNKIKQLQIKNNRYHTMINNALKRLAISYLATGNQNLACENFKRVGDITDFTVRNYLLDFCKEE